MHKSKIILSGWIKSMSSQLQPHFHLMKINIIWGSMEMRIIYCWGFRSTLCWLHDIDWVAFCRTLSPNVAVSSAFVATNWNDKIIYIYIFIWKQNYDASCCCTKGQQTQLPSNTLLEKSSHKFIRFFRPWWFLNIVTIYF